MPYHKRISMFSHVLSIIILPFNVTVIIPLLLLFFFDYTGWSFHPIIHTVLVIVGVVLFLFGLTLVILTIRQFAKRGKGTLAPWNPPQKLVISGPYRYTRNPMISGVVMILLGEGIIFASLPLLLWFILFTCVNYIYFIIGEEPHLAKKFGKEYEAYKKNVPRLIPRRTPWMPGGD